MLALPRLLLICGLTLSLSSQLPVGAVVDMARGVDVRLLTAALPSAAEERDNRILQKRDIGTSVQGRTIWAYRKGNPAARNKVVILGQMHGDERAAAKVARRIIDSVPVSRDADVWILPTMNPDGAAAGTRLNARGVDVNRNFDHRWRRQGTGTRVYSGPRAGSEPETRAVAAFLQQIRPKYVVGLHQPFLGVDSYAVKDRALMRRLAGGLRIPARPFACSGVCRGTLTGWFNNRLAGAALTVELGRVPTKAFLRRAAVAVLKATYAY